MNGKVPKIAKIGNIDNLNTNVSRNSLSNLFGGTQNVKVNDIITAEPFKSLFKVSDDVLNSIIESMRADGYDKNQPIIIWKEKGILIDGHTRLLAAKEVGIDNIPAFYANFNDEDSVLDYMYSIQFNRRNITDAELITLALDICFNEQADHNTEIMVDNTRKIFDGSKAKFLSEKIKNLSLTKAKMLVTLIEHPNFDNIQKSIFNNEATINSAYNNLQKDKKTLKEKVRADFFADDGNKCPTRFDEKGTFYFRNYESKKEYKAFALPANMNKPRIKERIQQVLDEELGGR